MCEFVINLKEILNNFNRAKAKLEKNVKVCAVIKADAYGFGANKICQLLNIKADYFAVARLSEFLRIEKIAQKPILILSPLSERETKVAIERDAELSISSIERLRIANNIARAKHKKAKIHLVVDTGMNRFGLKTIAELKSFLKALNKLKNIELVGVYSHLFDAGDSQRTSLQNEKFNEFRSIILKFGFTPIFHLVNSIGLNDKQNQFDMVRLGLGIYHSKSNAHCFKAQIVELKDILKGEYIGYSGTFIAERQMRVAVCSAGYADGVPLAISNCGQVLVNGQKANVVGRVCMDCFMCDVSGVGCEIGDEVVIFGGQKESVISVCELAHRCGTIEYEIYTGISDRVKRVYKWR